MLTAAAVIALLAVACDGSGDDVDITTSKTIGPNGGTVTSSDGRLVLDFPEGALPADNTITIERFSTDELPSEFQGVEAGAAYALGPDGLSFDEPVQVRFDTQADPVNAEGALEAPTGIVLTEGNGTATPIPEQQTRLSPDGVLLTGTLRHFSTLATTSGNSVVTISGVPHTMVEGETFTAKATVAVEPFADEAIEIREAGYRDHVAGDARIVPPETPTFETALRSPAEPPPEKVRLVRAEVEYRCQNEGEQEYKPAVDFILAPQPDLRDIPRSVGLRQAVFCLDPDAAQSTLTPDEGLLAALSPGSISRNVGQLFQVQTELEVNEPVEAVDVVITTTKPGIVSFPPTLASSNTNTLDFRPAPFTTAQESVLMTVLDLNPSLTSRQAFTYECIGEGETRLVYSFGAGDTILTTDVECTSGDVADGGDGSGGQESEAGLLISNTTREFDGSPKPVTVSTDPSGLDVEVTYNGSPEPPVNAGNYDVVATVQDEAFTGEAVATLTIEKASAGILITDTIQQFDGDPKPVTVLTSPAGLSTTVTYDGRQQAPSAVGTYEVEATVSDDNYEGTATGTLEIVNSTPVEAPQVDASPVSQLIEHTIGGSPCPTPGQPITIRGHGRRVRRGQRVGAGQRGVPGCDTDIDRHEPGHRELSARVHLQRLSEWLEHGNHHLHRRGRRDRDRLRARERRGSRRRPVMPARSRLPGPSPETETCASLRAVCCASAGPRTVRPRRRPPRGSRRQSSDRTERKSTAGPAGTMVGFSSPSASW
ncbi:MAG: MBG domain-containing protein [Arhodomonas sp.]|nr:MBG domain-containing protein [Arhodomonas sp.]